MGRSPCCDKNGLKKGPWTQEEDMKLIQYIQIHGPANWRNLPKNAGLIFISLFVRWSAIAARLPGRTDNEIKNYWNTHIRKRLLRMGIDPVTHAPRLDFLDLSALLSSPQLNLSNLLHLQTLLNPQALRLSMNLMSANNNQNSDILLQNLQQNQSPVFQPNQFENIINNQPIPPNFQNQNFNPMQENIGQFSTNSSGLIFQENLAPNTINESLPNNNLSKFVYGISDQTRNDLSENSSYQSMNSSCSNNFSFDSVLSTPLSSPPPPMNFDSAFINGSIEEEREFFGSDLFKFEIPESLNFDDFM
ncbi:hypothetical protein RD792_006195 [Penstemon davidsonii]|uniref:Uncharacterized protein n=1 Tax=Penstemon davidsonii TaxID=160366 RepID=A0ABR0DCI6_9LAMI|nr:hypothetical protein RD792_006195 [Penstemon davidsonii]